MRQKLNIKGGRAKIYRFFENSIIKMDRLLDRQSTQIQIAFNDAVVELRWLSRLDCPLHFAALDDPLLRQDRCDVLGFSPKASLAIRSITSLP